jgi:cystathionine gamma-synthase
VESHALLRRRVADLLMRATVKEYEKSVESDDVYLYQSGMAGITRFHDVAMKVRPYPVAVFGAAFRK